MEKCGNRGSKMVPKGPKEIFGIEGSKIKCGNEGSKAIWSKLWKWRI